MLNTGNFSKKDWTDSDTLKGAHGGFLAVFCNRHDSVACMHFMKSFKGLRNFYCSSELFEQNSNTGNVIEMTDEYGNVLHVAPSGYHNYANLFFIDDLLSAGLFKEEINRIRGNG